MSDLLDRIALAESGGNINARSPTPLSSAQGLFGFTDAAFNQVKQDHPDLANVTKEQWSTDPSLQRTFADRLKGYHERVLKGQGFEPTPTNIYANWHFGSGGGPKFLKSAPDTRMEDILDPVAIAANPHLQGKTQGQIYEWITKKMNGNALPNAIAQTQGNTMNEGTPNANDAMAIYRQILSQNQGAQPQFTPEQLQMLTGNRKQRASMLPLAIGASLAGDKRISALGGQLYQDASEAQGNMQLGNEGWLTPDGQMISNPFTQADRQESRNNRALTLALAMSKGQQAPAGYTWTTNQTGQRALAPIPGGPNDPNVRESTMPPPTGYRWTASENGQRTLQVIPGGPEDPSIKGNNITPPSGYRWAVGVDGQRTLQAIPGGPGDPTVKQEGQKPTEDENKSAGYALRIEQGLKTIKGITDLNKNAASPELLASTLSNIPFFGANLANSVVSNARQQVEAAQLDILDAALTLNTGAAYTKEQLQGLSKSYFPQIGDSDDTIGGKQARLNDLLETAKLRAGRMQPKVDKLTERPNAPAPGAGNGFPSADAIAAELKRRGIK